MNEKQISKYTKGNFNIRFKLQLILSFICTNLVLLLVASSFFYIQSLSIIKRRSSEDILQQLQQSEQNLMMFAQEAENLSTSLIPDMLTRTVLYAPQDSDAIKFSNLKSLFASMRTVLNNYNYIDSVYYFSSNGMIVGARKNSQLYMENAQQDVFYNTEQYQWLKNQSDGCYWVGHLRTSGFPFYNSQYPDINYITLCRKITLVHRQSVILLMNINEAYFRGLFFRDVEDTMFRRFIIDKQGRFISHTEQDNAYITALHIGEMDNLYIEQGYRIIYDKVSQIVTLPIELGNWTLVNVTPLAYLVKDALPLLNTIILICVLCILLGISIAVFWISRITKPLNTLTSAMSRTEKGDLGIVLDPKDVERLGVVGRQYNEMSLSIVKSLAENQRISEEKRRYEIESLWAKINPHFLYNTLNTLKWMSIISNNGNLTEGINSLASMLKPLFHREGDYSPLKDELAFMLDYIHIMNLRFGNSIRVYQDIPQELVKLEIVRMLFQPILENCIAHGMTDRQPILTIQIIIRLNGDSLSIRIHDDGKGMDDEVLHKLQEALHSSESEKTILSVQQGIGLINVHRRIQIYYGESCGITLKSNRNLGTDVMLLLRKL